MTQIAPPTMSAETAAPHSAPIKPSVAVAREFEVLFMGQIVDQMLKTIDFGSYSGGFGEDMWRSFMANALAEKIVDQSGIGLAGNIEDMLNAYRK